MQQPPYMAVPTAPLLLDEAGVLHDLGQVRLGPGEKAKGGMSRTTLHQLISAGEFPRPIPTTRMQRGKGTRQAWPRELVLSWLRDRMHLSYGGQFEADNLWRGAAWPDGEDPPRTSGG